MIGADNQQEWEIDNLPNRLTIFRLLLVPFVIGALFFNLDSIGVSDNVKSWCGWAAAWTFVVASITDFFDGFIARRRGIVTVFGSFLDPIADKFLVVSSLLMLQALDRIPVILVIILVMREFYISPFAYQAGDRGVTLPVGNAGKWKTAIQMAGTPMLKAYETPYGIPFPQMGTIAIYIAGFISVYSAMDYSLKLIKKLRHRKHQRV